MFIFLEKYMYIRSNKCVDCVWMHLQWPSWIIECIWLMLFCTHTHIHTNSSRVMMITDYYHAWIRYWTFKSITEHEATRLISHTINFFFFFLFMLFAFHLFYSFNNMSTSTLLNHKLWFIAHTLWGESNQIVLKRNEIVCWKPEPYHAISYFIIIHTHSPLELSHTWNVKHRPFPPLFSFSRLAKLKIYLL